MAQWEGKTRGNLLGYRIFMALIRWFGVSAAYQLLKIVSYYFYLFAGTPKRHMMHFYQAGMGFTEKQAKKLTRNNFYLIGQSLIDRVAFQVNKGDKFTYSLNGDHYLKQIAEEEKGGILISGHLGNWEIAGSLLKDFNKPIHVVMFDAEHEQIKKYLDQKTGGKSFNVIPLKEDISHIFLIKQALEKGELICIHGDRFLPGARTLTIDFLGKPARFPYGPFHIASKFAAPVSFVFGLKDSDFKYKLSATSPLPGGLSPEKYAADFSRVLEEKLKANPEQWFNYYDFFSLN